MTQGHITRPGEDLALFVPGDPPVLTDAGEACARYDFVPDGLDLGAPTVRYLSAETTYEQGARLLAAIEGMASGQLRMFVTGANGDDLQFNIGELVAALKQETFQVWITPDGVAVPYAWTFWRAQVSVGLGAPFWRGRWAPVVASVQRHPIPVSGPAI